MRGGAQRVGIGAAVRDGLKAAIRSAPNHRKEPPCLLLPDFREVGKPGLKLRFGHVLRVEIRARQFFRRDIRQKRRVIVQVRPRSFIQIEVVQPGLAQRRSVLPEPRTEPRIAAPELLEEDAIDDLRGLDELRERPLDAWSELRRIGVELRGREPDDHAIQLRKIGNCGSGQRHGNQQRGYTPHVLYLNEPRWFPGAD